MPSRKPLAVIIARMRIFILYILTTVFLLGCGHPNNEIRTYHTDIRKYMPTGHSYYVWRPSHMISKDYLIELILRPEDNTAYKYGDCRHYYPIKITSDSTVDLLWDFQADSECKPSSAHFDFLYWQDTVGTKDYPAHGDKFATYTLVNDSTLNVKYYFPEWANKVNLYMKDSIFPTYLHLADSSIFKF